MIEAEDATEIDSWLEHDARRQKEQAGAILPGQACDAWCDDVLAPLAVTLPRRTDSPLASCYIPPAFLTDLYRFRSQLGIGARTDDWIAQ